MSFLGIDLGTSFIKGAVLHLESRQLEHVRRIPFPDPVATGDPLQCEYEPQQVVSAVQLLIDELAPHVPDCEGVALCAQMHGMVLVNDRRQAVSNCLTWRDQRALLPHPSGSGSYFDAILARTNPAMRRQLGNELEPPRPICFLFWFAEQGRLAQGATPASLPDYVISGLCGSEIGVEATNASAYGAFNLETSDWHHGLIRALGLDHLHWPALRKQGKVAGYLKVGLKSVPCYAPVGDAQAALAGSLLTADELSLNIATGAQVSRLTHRLQLGDHQTRPFFDGQFLNTFSYPPAGRELSVMVGLLSEIATAQNVELPDPWAYIAQATSKTGGADLEVALDFLSAQGGAITGARADNLNVGQLFRSAFRSMADSYYQCALRLWPEKSWRNLVLSGGLVCRMNALRKSIQEKFGSGWRLSPFAEDTLFGLLILASVFSGKAASVAEVSSELRRKSGQSD